jgi:hypothetical protein
MSDELKPTLAERCRGAFVGLMFATALLVFAGMIWFVIFNVVPAVFFVISDITDAIGIWAVSGCGALLIAGMAIGAWKAPDVL